VSGFTGIVVSGFSRIVVSGFSRIVVSGFSRTIESGAIESGTLDMLGGRNVYLLRIENLISISES
jgi:hypothetical protein